MRGRGRGENDVERMPGGGELCYNIPRPQRALTVSMYVASISICKAAYLPADGALKPIMTLTKIL